MVLHSGGRAPHDQRSSCSLSLPMWQPWSLIGTKWSSFYRAASTQPHEDSSQLGFSLQNNLKRPPTLQVV
jgi:hypothetical protein